MATGGGERFRDDLLDVKIYKRSDMNVIAAKGEIDLSNISVVEDAIDDVLARDLPLLLDFTGLRYIDSTGLNVLARVNERARQRRVPFAIAANPTVRRILGVLSLHTVFPVFPDTAQAREYFRSSDRAGFAGESDTPTGERGGDAGAA